ncbi:MAG: 50S ribosomal protein L24 [Sandaracinaceae bacterium]|nr:50S ribosomal protein L24 [Sandaracinaceae bacterium]MCC6876256.1 50S ribosomal protein L24 [Sandaracinaceae bacterium]
MARIKKDDVVVVITGRDKGSNGRVLKVLREQGRVIVEGVNVVKRHTRPTPQQPEGGIIEKEMPIDASNVMLLDSKEQKPTRVGFKTDDEGKKIRVSKRSGTVLEG